MGSRRRIERGRIKNYISSNDIKEEWKTKQIASRGLEGYLDLKNKNRRKKDNKISILTEEGIQEVIK